MTKADAIRKWFAGKPAPCCTADCKECAEAVGSSPDVVWVVMRHEKTVEQRRAYYAAYHRRRYLTDAAYRERKRKAAMKRYYRNQAPAEA